MNKLRLGSISYLVAPALLAATYLSLANDPSETASAQELPGSLPAAWVDESGLHTAGFGELSFMARDGNQLSALTYRSTNFNGGDDPIWFVMHGASRNAKRYIETAAPIAERHNALTIVIKFPKIFYPSSSDYTLGVTTQGKANAKALEEGRWRSPNNYLYTEIEHVFEAVKRSLNSEPSGYFLFGHSAGAQFSHRLMTFLPDANVLGAVAANAGWYTLPLIGAGSSYTMPYGLRATPLDESDLRTYLAAPLTVLVGERDTTTPTTDRMVRGTREAMTQGKSRRERGEFFYMMGEGSAQALETTFGWRFDTVPRAKHSAGQMIASAGFFLFSPGEAPCAPTYASDNNGLLISEILADPPSSMRGDSNGDGKRDSSDDEFVELVNTGDTAVCLAGWTLGDASRPERHVFPLGRALAPGQALLVFGGGVPTGPFSGAETQTVAFGGRLNLNNGGDVLTLRDHSGNIAARVSWGDCDARPCADEHINRDLGINASIVRWPEATDEWLPHTDVSNTPFSPGGKTDGTAWQSDSPL